MGVGPGIGCLRVVRADDKYGSIMPGRDADFVVFNPDLSLVETYVGGNSVGNAFAEWPPKKRSERGFR